MCCKCKGVGVPAQSLLFAVKRHSCSAPESDMAEIHRTRSFC